MTDLDHATFRVLPRTSRIGGSQTGLLRGVTTLGDADLGYFLI